MISDQALQSVVRGARVDQLMMLFETLSPNQDYITCSTMTTCEDNLKGKIKISKDFGSSYILD